MSAHSPAPWRFVPPGGTNKYCDEGEDQGGFYDANGDRVCWFGDGSTYYPSDGDAPGEVDANLIAAAPELLNELRELAELAHNAIDVPDSVWAVIAKATGAA